MVSLCKIFDKYKCDKGSTNPRRKKTGHRYDRVYEPILETFGDKEINILEIGIYKGASIEAFVEYLPKANIVGVDIFTRLPAENISILNHERVQWYNCDSISGPTLEFIEMSKDKFDVIIDDGLHTHIAQKCTFENFIPFLKDDGVYFIEDVWAFDYLSHEDKQHPWLLRNSDTYSEDLYKDFLAILSGYEVLFHDLREDHEPDSFIIEVRK